MKNALKKFLNKNKISKVDKENNLRQAKDTEETLRQRRIVKEKLYPILVEGSRNVENAKIICEALAIGLRQKFNNKIKDYSVLGIGIKEDLANNSEDYNTYIKLIEELASENVGTAASLLEGMAQVIDSFIREENNKKQLKDIKATFL